VATADRISCNQHPQNLGAHTPIAKEVNAVLHGLPNQFPRGIDLLPENESRPYVRIMRLLDLKGRSARGKASLHYGNKSLQSYEKARAGCPDRARGVGRNRAGTLGEESEGLGLTWKVTFRCGDVV